MVSLFDPLDLVGRTVGVARLGLRVAVWTERQALELLRARIDAQVPRSRELTAGPESRIGPLDARMRHLLERALDQSTSDSQAALFHQILDQLVPDEARILGALSDGSVSPLVNVHMRTRAAARKAPLLENASLVGRTANLALPRMTPKYVTHLLDLGLVELGPEDTSLKTQYEILLAETHVLKAVKDASRGPLAAKVAKRTLRLSELGASLWNATGTGTP